MQNFLDAARNVAGALRGDASDSGSDATQSDVISKKAQQTEAAVSREHRLGMGAPPKKQAQQEEVLAPLDEEEREALVRRMQRRNGGGAYATARLGSAGRDRAMTPMGYPAASNAGHMSPSRQRLDAITARREDELRTLRERAKTSRDRARRAAQHTARLQAAREAAEEARREEARRAAIARQLAQQERERLAAQSARKAVPAIGNIRRAMPPPPTEKALLRKKRQQRPEWGQGHAGGYKLKAQPKPPQPKSKIAFELPGEAPPEQLQGKLWAPMLPGWMQGE